MCICLVIFNIYRWHDSIPITIPFMIQSNFTWDIIGVFRVIYSLHTTSKVLQLLPVFELVIVCRWQYLWLFELSNFFGCFSYTDIFWSETVFDFAVVQVVLLFICPQRVFFVAVVVCLFKGEVLLYVEKKRGCMLLSLKGIFFTICYSFALFARGVYHGHVCVCVCCMVVMWVYFLVVAVWSKKRPHSFDLYLFCVWCG